MAFASFDSKNASAPMAEINMVPLIDVMLVLLVIFMVTAPLLTHAVKLDLPNASSQANPPKPDAIAFSIDASGQRFWGKEPISREQAVDRFRVEALKQPQPELHLHVDQAAAYKAVAETMADASQAGLAKVGFVTQPERK